MRTATAIWLVAIGIVSSGCSLCAPGYLCDYGGVGGKWQRTDPENGRVGSILSDPNSVVNSSGQTTEVVNGDSYEYEEGMSSGESILESPENIPTPAEEGMIILGDQM